MKDNYAFRSSTFMRALLVLLFMAVSIQWGFAQLNLNVSRGTLGTVIEQIKSQSKYQFFYDDKLAALSVENVKVNNVSIEDALNVILKGKNISYKVEDNIVYLSEKTATSQEGKQQGKERTITGVVSDDMGPLIGVNVLVKGTSNGCITDLDGNFTLTTTEANPVLVFSYIGYKSQEISATGSASINVLMQNDTQMIEEVVVTALGIKRSEKALSYNVQQVNTDAITSNKDANFVNSLSGKVAGVNINASSSGVGGVSKVVMRGTKGIDQSSNALYVIDGVPMFNLSGEGGQEFDSKGSSEAIADINPEDIESINVLKDAASAAIYGARAAGGVILVTTKRPKGETSFQLNYNNNFAFATAMNLPEQAPLMEYLQAYSDAAGDQFWTMGSPSVSKWMGYLEQYRNNPSSIPTVGDGIFKDTDGAVYYMNEKDLVKNMLETSFQHTHNISMTGGTDKLRYRLSAGFIDNDGVLITDKDKYRRMNVSGFISANVTKWFTQEATFSYAHSKRMEPKSALGAVYSTRLASFYPEGNMPEGISAAGDGLPFFTPSNQIRWSNPEKTLYDNPRIFLKSILKPLKGFEIAFEYTFDKNIYDYSWYTGSVVYTTVQGGKDTTPTNDYLQKKKRYTDYNSINLYGTYDFSLGNHQFKIMAGFNQESSYQETMEALSYGQAVIEVPSLGSGTSTLKATDKYNEFSVRGGFFRVNYNYQDKYLLEVNGRYDGSSKFPKESRYGFFPSVSAGWNIAQEKFMESTQNWLGSLKLRASYGMIGNQNVPAYSFIPTMAVNNKYNGWISNGNYVTAITSIPSLVSRNFTWEKVGTLDIGIDFSMFSNRFTGTFDWYQRNTNGMLAPGVQLPAVVGADAPYQNTADMRTRGWELSFNWRDQIGKVSYRVGFNLSDSKSKIVKYDSNSSYILSSQKTNALTGETYTFWEFYKGKELGEIWGYETDGYYTVDDFVDTSSWKLKDGVPSIDGYNPRPGDVKFKNLMDDERGTNMISSGNNTLNNPGDRKVIGNETPRYLYGINLGLNYKGFDLSAFLQGTGKRDKWIANTLTFPLYSDFKFIPLYKGLGDYWQPVDAANGDYTAVNPNAEFPRIYGNYGNQGSNYRQSDKYLSDASYLRIKNVTLSYTFPKAWITKISLSQLRAFVSVENLATFSSLPKGIDPETLKWDYPAFRTVSFGLNLTL